MIDQGTFKNEWEILCDRFGRTPSRAVAARYYQSLSPRMGTDEFRLACRELFDSSEFFPRPDDFIDAVEGSGEERAVAQWDLCQSVMRGNREALEKMSPEGRKTVALLGGPGRLRQTKLDDVQWVRKEFFRLFNHAIRIYRREQKQLPEWTDEGREKFSEAVGKKLLQNPS